MAVKVAVKIQRDFGEPETQITIAQASVEDVSSGEIISQKAFDNPKVVKANQLIRFKPNELFFTFKRGAASEGFKDAGLTAVYKEYFNRKDTRIRLYTQPASAPPVEVSATGYTSATITAGQWNYTTETE